MKAIRTLSLSAALLAGALLAMSAAPAAARGSDQCLLSTNVQNFTAPDDHTVYLRVGANQIWRLALMNNCLEIPNHLSVGLEAAAGDPWICHPIQATIIDHGVGVPRRCRVSAMHLLTPAEVAALPRSLRP